MKILNAYNIKAFTIVICLFFCSILLNAQTGIVSEKSLGSKHSYVVKFWNSENGLPQNSVLSCLQTSDGYLWFSTHEGLIRFDGNVFKLFNTSNTPSIGSSSSFRYLFEDSQHIFWLISQKNKLIKYEGGIFKELNLKESITSICENANEEILVSGSSGNIYKLDNQNLSLVLKLENHHIHKLLSNHQKELFIASDKGLYSYHNKELLIYPEFEKQKQFHITLDENGNVWALGSQGLYKIEDDKCLPYLLPFELRETKIYNSLLVINESHFLINTNSGVVVVKDDKSKKIDFNNGLSSNATTTLFKDKENNIWVGTSNGGINKLKEKSIFTYDKQDGLSDDGCGALFPLKDKSILISNYCKGLSLYKDQKFSAIPMANVGCIWSTLKDKDDNLWLGTYNQGLFKLTKRDTLLLSSKNQNQRNDYFSIFQDSRNNIWIGTDDGLYKYENNQLVRIEKDLIKGRVSYITEDRKNHIWICTENGLVLMTRDNIKLYTIKDGLPSNKVRHLYEDKEGTLWISTYNGGIGRFKNKKFFAFNASEMVIDNFTSCIVEDDAGNLWISSNRGIYRASRKNLNEYADGKSLFIGVQYFGKEDGMKNSECNGGFQYAGLKLEDGQIMFPTVSGIALVNPKLVAENFYQPQIIIENIKANEKIIPLSDSAITISNNTHKLEINFTAPFFGDAKNLLFECKLEGYDKAWRTPTTERSMSYHDLPPGDYVFKIGVYGYVNEKQILFKIPYPFWQTGLFYIILAISTAIVFFVIVYFRTRNIRQKEFLKTEINKQYAALELKALQSQMNPHFMFNCLNTIKYFISVDDKTSANKYLGKFSKLIRLFLEHANSNTIKLSEEVHMLSLYIEMEQLRLDNSFDYKLHIRPEVNMSHVEIPTMLLQPYVENAIHHGLRNKTKHGSLIISIKAENEILIITIDDNGVGREKSNEIKQASVKEHTSMGMKITAERIETLNYIKNTHIETEIVDKMDENGIALGTSVFISIPINIDNHD